jgi:hypothetical protein
MYNITKVCPTCHKDFIVPSSRKRKVFCSWICRSTNLDFLHRISETLKRRFLESGKERKVVQPLTEKRLSADHKENIRLSLLGKKHIEESKRKIRESNKRSAVLLGRCSPKIVITCGYCGIVFHVRPHQSYRKYCSCACSDNSESRRKLIGLGHVGEKSATWKGGIAKSLYPQGWTPRLRRKIKERDGRGCFFASSICSSKLAIHHIDYDKKNCSPKNLITLCTSCNSKVNFHRDHWRTFFQTWMKEHHPEYFAEDCYFIDSNASTASSYSRLILSA